MIGLATVTSTCGKAVWANGAVLPEAQLNALHDTNIIFNRRRISNPSLIGMTCVPVHEVSKQTSVAEAVFSHCSDGVWGSAWLEEKINAVGNLHRSQIRNPLM